MTDSRTCLLTFYNNITFPEHYSQFSMHTRYFFNIIKSLLIISCCQIDGRRVVEWLYYAVENLPYRKYLKFYYYNEMAIDKKNELKYTVRFFLSWDNQSLWIDRISL